MAKRIVSLTLTLLAFSLLHGQGVALQPGDLLFFRDTSGMGAAVRESTGEYTHVAIVERVGDTVWVIDATRKFGVSRRPLEPCLPTGPCLYDAYRVKHLSPSDVDAILALARTFLGQPYDEAFLPDNGRMYCSELVYECYIVPVDTAAMHAEDQSISHLFESHPMNWRDKEGRMPKYWQQHFEQLGMPVPEGVLGTNPTDLSRSPLLRKISPSEQ